MKCTRSGLFEWFCRYLSSKGVVALVLILMLPFYAYSQSSSVQTGNSDEPAHPRRPVVPEQLTLPNVPIFQSDIDKVSRRIRAATDYLFGRVQPSNVDVFRKEPFHRASREAQALHTLKAWLEQAGCVNRADIPLLSDRQPSAFALQTTSPGQVPLTVNFRLIGQKSQTVKYTIWLAPGPGLRHIDMTWENSSPR